MTNDYSVIELLQPTAILLVLRAQRPGPGIVADLGRGHVPPGPAAGQEAMLLHLRDDDAGTPLGPGLAQGPAELLGVLDVPGPGAEALGIAGEIDPHILPFEPVGRRVPVAEF